VAVAVCAGVLFVVRKRRAIRSARDSGLRMSNTLYTLPPSPGEAGNPIQVPISPLYDLPAIELQERKLSCQVCAATFDDDAQLQAHIKRKHARGTTDESRRSGTRQHADDTGKDCSDAWSDRVCDVIY
jgi:hypothetical protein